MYAEADDSSSYKSGLPGSTEKERRLHDDYKGKVLNLV